MDKRRWGRQNSLKHYTRKKKWKLEAYNKVFDLPTYFDELIGDKTSVHILDIGSGPLSTTGSRREGVDVHITCADVLAEEWNELYPESIIPVEYQNMEKLTYDDNSFDIVHCVNALDHVDNPRAALEEMVRVTRGTIYLRHNVNEGESENYVGYHTWNIEPKGNDCRFWTPEQEFLLSDIADGWYTEIRVEDTNSPYYFGEQVVSIYK